MRAIEWEQRVEWQRAAKTGLFMLQDSPFGAIPFRSLISIKFGLTEFGEGKSHTLPDILIDTFPGVKKPRKSKVM